MEKVYSGFASASSTQSNNPEAYKFTKRKSMTELVPGLAPSMQSNAIFSASRKVDDFKLKAPVLSERPLTAKLGTKEGLYVDQRFFAYEYELDKKGNEVKKRTAVVRAVTISENDTVATGASTPSVFRQHGGKAVYQGTLLEMKEDFGLGLTMGYVLQDQFVGGVHVGVDLRITGITGKILKPKVNKLLRSWYLNVNLSYLPKGDNMKFANTEFNTGNEVGEYVWGSRSANTSSLAFGLGIFREVRVTRRANLYLLPELAFGLYSFDMESPESFSISNPVRLNASNFYSTIGCGIAWQWSPAVSFLFKPNLYFKGSSPVFEFYDAEDEEITIDGYSGEGWLAEYPLSSAFNDLLNNKLGLTLGLRFKF
jgi:hypothetical protein